MIYGGGTPRQIENCTAFARQANLEIVAVHQGTAEEEAGDKALGWQAALQDIEEGRANILLVESLDRIPVPPEARVQLHSRIEQAGAMLICSEAHRADGAAFEFHSQISQAIEDYRQTLIEQILEQSVLLSEATRARLSARALQTGQDINQLADALLSEALSRDD